MGISQAQFLYYAILVPDCPQIDYEQLIPPKFGAVIACQDRHAQRGKSSSSKMPKLLSRLELRDDIDEQTLIILRQIGQIVREA